MKYRQLLKTLQEIPDDRLDDEVTIYNESQDEFYPAHKVKIAEQDEQDVLDEGCLYITFSEEEKLLVSP